MRNVVITSSDAFRGDTDSEHPQEGVRTCTLTDGASKRMCTFTRACFEWQKEEWVSSAHKKKKWSMCVREIQLTAGRLQVQISFPSASLLIKQLNGLKKVVLRVKTVKEERHRHTHTSTCVLQPNISASCHCHIVSSKQSKLLELLSSGCSYKENA